MVTAQRPNCVSLSAAYCLTTLWWCISSIGIAYAQEELRTAKSATESVATPKSTIAIGHPTERTTHQDVLISTGHAQSPASGHSYAMMPLELNRHVKRNLDFFQNHIHERFQTFLDRFERYKDMVQDIFIEAGLPPELGYLSLVESGFDTRAYSPAHASGPWQFMEATGRSYGLDVTWYLDTRRDPIKSTRAAAYHLRDLFDRFGSWPLALGAYNAGGVKISRAIEKSESRDFWEIRKTRYLRRETKEYVPKFIAAAIIASNPRRYGFKVNTAIPYAFDKVLIYKRAHLKAVAKTTGLSLRELKELNPELLRNIIPIVQGGYSLKVPVGTGSLVRERHDQIEMWTKLPAAAATWYRVRFGDTLDEVAQRFGLSKQELKRLNNLTEDIIRWNDRLRVKADENSVTNALEAKPSPPVTWYRVHFGDTLEDVAQKFDLSVSELKRLNNLTEDIIRWNDRLRVKADENSVTNALEAEPSPPVTWYRVHFGDTLEDVAQKFDLSVSELKRLNNLTEDIIRWNDRLRVKANEDNPPVVFNPKKDTP